MFLIHRSSFNYFSDGEIVHLVIKHRKKTVCGVSKIGWKSVLRQQVDCVDCADTLRTELTRDAEDILGYDRYRELGVTAERQRHLELVR